LDYLKDFRRVLGTPPDGAFSFEALYRIDSFVHTTSGGFSFYAPGPEEVGLTTTKEATFAYTYPVPRCLIVQILYTHSFVTFPLSQKEAATNTWLCGWVSDFGNSLSCSGAGKTTDCFSGVA